MIDLHTHSTASDGSLSPRALVKEAARLGLTALALTDHDTVSGLAAAAGEAAARKIAFIPGIELEIHFPEVPGEFHLLGLGLWKMNEEFLAAVKELAEEREKRNEAILALMRKAGIAAERRDIAAFSEGRTIGRLHFAAYLVKRRVVRNYEQAFTRYLGKGKPFYAPKAGLDFARAARLIHETGGLSSLAHPRSLDVRWERLPALLAGLKDRGLDCVEAWHPSASAAVCRRLEALSRGLGLGITAGSDFHGAARPTRQLGRAADTRAIPGSFLAALPQLSQPPASLAPPLTATDISPPCP